MANTPTSTEESKTSDIAGPLFKDSPTLLSAIQDDIDNLHKQCSKVDPFSADDIVDFWKKSDIKLMKLSIMAEMLKDYLERGK